MPVNSLRPPSHACALLGALSRSGPLSCGRISSSALAPAMLMRMSMPASCIPATTTWIRCHSDYYLPALLIRVLPHASRLRSIDLTGFIEVYQSQPSHICFPGLRCAAFYVNGHEDIQRIDPFHFLSDAPQLREVNIQMSLQSKARAVRLPMSWKLTHLGFSLGWVCTPLDLLPTVAQYATTLHSFSCNTEKLDTKSMHPIDLPALNRINIERDAHALLKFISAPNLQKIRLTTTRHGDPFASLLAFLSSPKAPVATLRYLKLDKISHNFREQTTRELLHCLERMHDLRGLTISADPDFYERRSSRDMYVPPCFWEGLTVRDGETPILPNLSLFRVFFGGVPLVGEAHELQRRPLRAMLHSRETARVIQGRRVVALERVEVLDEEDISTV